MWDIGLSLMGQWQGQNRDENQSTQFGNEGLKIFVGQLPISEP